MFTEQPRAVQVILRIPAIDDYAVNCNTPHSPHTLKCAAACRSATASFNIMFRLNWSSVHSVQVKHRIFGVRSCVVWKILFVHEVEVGSSLEIW